MVTERHEIGSATARNGTANGTGAARKGRRSEAQRTAELTTSLPVGIQIGMWTDGRRKPFFVRFGKNRSVASFELEQDRNDRADRLAQERQDHGAGILDFDARQVREWQEFRARCQAPLHELEALWQKHSGRKPAMVTQEAAETYKAFRLAEDLKEKSDTFRHVKLHLKRLTDVYSLLPLDTLTADLLRDLLAKLKHPRTGAPMTNLTKRHHRKDWNTFFKRAKAEGWIDRNPCETVIPPKIDEEDKYPLSAQDIFKLLKANRDQPVIGRMAFELFGGLRCSSVERLTAEHVKRAIKGVRMPGAQHKSGQSKFRQGHPDVLWAWHDHAGDAMWTGISQKNYDQKKQAAFIRAGVTNMGNALRDSFASYLLALTKNVPTVSYLMQHRKTTTTEIYEGIAEEADARLVMAMTPNAVLLTWEEFRQSKSITNNP